MTYAIVTVNHIQPLIDLVCNAVTSTHTKRAYRRALTDFMSWHAQSGQAGFTKATVQAYVSGLRSSGTSASSINQRLTAIRKLAIEAADNELIDQVTAQAIGRVEGVRLEGKSLGNWLSKSQAQTILGLPDVATVRGLRDRAVLAVLLGCGLRREECAGLTVEHIQQREGRWVIVDLVGKRSKKRSVPMPTWCKAAIDAYKQAATIDSGALFRRIRRGGHIQAGGMTSQAVFDVVKDYAELVGVPALRPHDLRRTFAKLAHKGHAPVEQIQLSLGHSSLQTTEKYIGVQQDLHAAPCDALGLRL